MEVDESGANEVKSEETTPAPSDKEEIAVEEK